MFIILTIVDEDFLDVEHVIATMTVLGIIVTICRSVIPDEVIIFTANLSGGCCSNLKQFDFLFVNTQ